MACGGNKNCGGSKRKPSVSMKVGRKMSTKNTIKSITRKTRRG